MHDYYHSKPWSPFCSERCQLIDLGAWASEEHRIKGEAISASENSDNLTFDSNAFDDITDEHSDGFIN